ncbi:ArsC/Spx/MgsR family protein [Lactococcus garvieae]|uniref:ArsC/Spx/MgsR family protein n=1 Tax=Lactococcus garvieae TaxID=1363 RepID=UPI003851AE4E
MQALVLLETGFPSLLKQRNKTGQTIRTLLDHLYDLNFQEERNFILGHPEVLQTPLMLDAKKLLVGYHLEDLRVFLPREYRSRDRH